MIVGVDHTLITVPAADVEKARAFYCGLLGLREIEKPESLRERGGFWLQAGDRQVHVGVEEGVQRLATKAHIAYAVLNVDEWHSKLTAAGLEVMVGLPITGRRRLEFRDPFGNRVEFIELPRPIATVSAKSKVRALGEAALRVNDLAAMRRFYEDAVIQRSLRTDRYPTRSHTMARPAPDEYAPAYAPYVALVPEDKIVPVLKSTLAETLALLHDVSDEEACRLHTPYTWTIKQVIGHLTDSERVFGYRALRFARGDATPLPGFDENLFARSTVFRDRSLSSLAAEFELVRNSHVIFFDNLGREDWDKRGIANNAEMSVRALAFSMAGHHRHHATIVRKRLRKG